MGFTDGTKAEANNLRLCLQVTFRKAHRFHKLSVSTSCSAEEDELVGKTITFRYQEVGNPEDAPRIPIFRGFREKWDLSWKERKMISLKLDKRTKDTPSPRHPQLKPMPEITIPGRSIPRQTRQSDGTLTGDLKNLSTLANLKIDVRPEPQMEYEVLENGEWLPVDEGKGTEMLAGGILRYIKDGFGKTALPGNWRGKLTEKYATEYAAYEDQLLVLGARKLRRKILWSVATFIMLIVLLVLVF